MRHTIPFALCLLTLCACSTPTGSIDARYGSMKASGSASASAGGLSGSNSLSEMGLDSSTGTPALAGDLKWGMPHLWLSAMRFDTSGSGTLSSDFGWDGVTIPAGASVDSKLDLGMYTGALTFDFIPGKHELGLGIGAAYFDTDLQVTDKATGTTAKVDGSIPVPTVAAAGGLSLGNFELKGLLSGISFSYDGDKLEYYDLDVNVRWHFLGGSAAYGALGIGWRQSSIDLDYTDGADVLNADLEIKGPYLSLGLGF